MDLAVSGSLAETVATRYVHLVTVGGLCTKRKMRGQQAVTSEHPICQTSPGANGIGSRYILTLHQRVQELERNSVTQVSVDAAKGSNNPTNPVSSADTYEVDASDGAMRQGASQTRIKEVQVLPHHQEISLEPQEKGENINTTQLSCPFESPSNVTGMGAKTGVDDDELFPNQRAEYFGISSTSSLMSLLSQKPRTAERPCIILAYTLISTRCTTSTRH